MDKQKENKELRLENIIIVGQAKGTYSNASVTKEFEAYAMYHYVKWLCVLEECRLCVLEECP